MDASTVMAAVIGGFIGVLLTAAILATIIFYLDRSDYDE